MAARHHFRMMLVAELLNLKHLRFAIVDAKVEN